MAKQKLELKEEFELVVLRDLPDNDEKIVGLMVPYRLDRKTIPEGLHCYDVRDDGYGENLALEKLIVVVDFNCQILVPKKIHFLEEVGRDHFDLDEYMEYYTDEDGNEEMTVEDFMVKYCTEDDEEDDE